MIVFNDWQIQTDGDLFARQYDNLSRVLFVQGAPEEYNWRMHVQVGDNFDIIYLYPMDGGVGVVLTDDMLPISGYYMLQLEATRKSDGVTVQHTNRIRVSVEPSMTGNAKWPTVPSEFKQLEQRVQAQADRAEESSNTAVSAMNTAVKASNTAVSAKETAVKAQLNATTAESMAKTYAESAGEASAAAFNSKTVASQAAKTATEESTLASAAASNAADAAAKAAGSAESASGYLSSVQEAANAAKDSETAAKASETAAKASETAAKASETAAKASETAANTSAANAKASAEAAAASAANAGKTFVATYGVTTTDEIYAAYQAGKAIFCNYNGMLASLYTIEKTDEAVFLYHTDAGMYSISADPSGWSYEYRPAVDTTLTASGKAADAAAVGARLSSLSEEIAGIPSGKAGVGIQSVEQTTTSTEDGGTNIVTVTKTDGTTSTFSVRNGSKGSTGPAGADGKDGADGQDGADGAAGPAGADGKSAYQYAKDGGYTGTEAEFAAKLASEEDYPTYAKAEMQLVLDKLYAKMGLKNPIIIGVSTDQHISKSNATVEADVGYGLKTLRDLTKSIPFNVIALLGDATNSTTSIADIQRDVVKINEFVSGAACPVVQITGNHDAWQNAREGSLGTMDNSAIFKSHIAAAVSNGWIKNCDSISTNAYMDDAGAKIRFIFVDASPNATYRPGYTGQMGKEWLQSCLSGLPDGYKAIIFSHYPLDARLSADGWTDKQDWASYITPYAKSIICCICGHNHNSVSEVADGILYISTTCAGKSGEDGLTRVYGTADATAYDVYVIDTDTETIYIIRYGIGDDRTLSYAETVVTYGITSNLSNCTNSNSAASATAGSQYTATISADDGYTLDSIIVTMGGTDITSTAVSGGNISIASVTGDIVITASASVAAAGYTNMLPLAVDSDGSAFNGGHGWTSGYRLNSSGGTTAATNGCTVTGFIPAKKKDVLHLAGIELHKTGSTNDSYQRIVAYDSSFAYIATQNLSSLAWPYELDDNGCFKSITVGTSSSAVAYIRMSGFTFSDETIVTVNEPIT